MRWIKACSHCARHRTAPDGTGRCRPVSSGAVRRRPATFMQIICKCPLNMAADVADVVLASATFLYVFESDLSEQENDEEERRQRKRRRPRRF